MYDYSAEILHNARAGEPTPEARFREELSREKAESKTPAKRTRRIWYAAEVEHLVERNLQRVGSFIRLA